MVRSSLGRGLLVAAVVALPLSAFAQVPTAPMPHTPVPVDEFKKGLTAALGDNFEYLGGEAGWTTSAAGTRRAERFWYARVKAKTAGEFAVSYTVEFHFPGMVKTKRQPPDRAVYTFPIRIGEKGAPRVVSGPGSHGGSAYPHANVGDTLLIPVHVDWYVTGHAFAAPAKDEPHVKAFFSVAGDAKHETYLKLAAPKPVVTNDTGGRLDLLASWHSSFGDRPGISVHHSLTGYLEFKQPGEFNLAGRLQDADEKAAGDGVPYRVVAKDQPITVVLEYFSHTEHTGKSRFHMSNYVKPGTVEVRVGDRALVGCGGYVTPAKPVGGKEEERQGVVVIRPFTNVEPYRPEPK
jgi:hypothetical protein